MADNKDEKPKYDSGAQIKTYKELHQKARIIGDTAHMHHTKAYVHAADKVLLKDGKYDFSILDNEEHQGNFVNEMSNFYVERAAEYFKIKDFKPEDQLQADMLMKAYAGITKGEISKLVKTHGKNYTSDKHENLRDKIIEQFRSQLNKSAAGHLTEKDIATLVKEMNLEKEVDHTRMTLDDAISLYGLHEAYGGGLTATQIKQQHKAAGQPIPIYLKEPKKEEEKPKP